MREDWWCRYLFSVEQRPGDSNLATQLYIALISLPGHLPILALNNQWLASFTLNRTDFCFQATTISMLFCTFLILIIPLLCLVSLGFRTITLPFTVLVRVFFYRIYTVTSIVCNQLYLQTTPSLFGGVLYSNSTSSRSVNRSCMTWHLRYIW